MGGCDTRSDPAAQSTTTSLAETRAKYATALVRKSRANEPVEAPPEKLFRLVTFPAPLGNHQAYLSLPSNGDTSPKPAIIWIFGGFDNSIGDTAWANASPDNDQSASAFRKAGIITMYPSLRGGNTNPGFNEGLFGEVEDVIAAHAFLAKQPQVDPKRIYLGGHSTGGTLTLLVAESTDKFRAVFSFGPIADISGYGEDNLPIRLSDTQEVKIRSPVHWLRWIHSQTFVFEGSSQPGNLESLRMLERANENSAVKFFAVPRANHFSILAPATRVIAEKILRDNKPEVTISFSQSEIDSMMDR